MVKMVNQTTIHKMKRYALFIPLLLAALICISGIGLTAKKDDPLPPGTIDGTPCNPNASENAKNVLAYLAALTARTKTGVISGQNCGHGNEIAHGNYDSFIETLYKQTGQYPGMIGIDYGYMREFSLDELVEANQYLIDYWNKGGLVTINWSPTNPWGDKNTYEDIRTKYGGTDLKKLITPGSPVYDRWMAKLDRIAAALQNLQKSGVVVLWRPMQEMNGWWFWWGKTDMDSLSLTHNAYIALWRHMYNYFTNEKGLNNILWVFSPNYGQVFSSFPYPGDDYVDIIGGTQYSAALDISGYLDYLHYKKPVGMAEYGPDLNSPNGHYDNLKYVQRLKKDYPRIAYWVTWHSWPGEKMALADNDRSKELMNDGYVINRGDRLNIK